MKEGRHWLSLPKQYRYNIRRYLDVSNSDIIGYEIITSECAADARMARIADFNERLKTGRFI